MKAPSAQPDHFVHDRMPAPEAWPTLRYDLPELQIANQANLVQALFDQAERAGHIDRPLLRGPHRTYTYRDARTEAARIAEVLTQDHGLVPGNRVLLRAPNNPMLVACWFAVMKAGGIAVATMPLLRAKELWSIVDIGKISHALCDAHLAEEMRLTALEHPGLRHLRHFNYTIEDGIGLPWIEGDKGRQLFS